MGVIYADGPKSVCNFHTLVNQHAHAELLECQGEISRVMIAEDAENAVPATHRTHNGAHMRIHVIVGAVHFEAVIAGNHAHVDWKPGEAIREHFSQPRHAVDVEIRQVKDPE